MKLPDGEWGDSLGILLIVGGFTGYLVFMMLVVAPLLGRTP